VKERALIDWNEIMNRPSVIQAVEEQKRLQAEYSKVAQEMTKHVEFATSSMQRVAEQARIAIEKLRPPESVLANISRTTAVIRNLYNTGFGAEIARIAQRLEKVPDELKTAIWQMALHGWYFDFKMTMQYPLIIRQAIDAHELDTVDQSLVVYFRERVDDIEGFLSAQFPERSRIFASAFDAHRNGAYDLSVPVFLTQVDGVCFDATGGKNFFQGNHKSKTELAIAENVRDISRGVFFDAITKPLIEKSPIAYSTNERRIHPEAMSLNRHKVLHGESIDYGNEVNSLKSISLLNYVTQVLSPEEQL
jgi:hypothetical protein